MADKESTAADENGKPRAPDAARVRLDGELQRQKDLHEREIERRDRARAEIGATVVAKVDRRMKRYEGGPYPRELELWRLTRSRGTFLVEHAPRSKSWKGPTHGKSYSDADELEAATLRECAAGYEASWGRAMTARDREVHVALVRGIPQIVAEQESRARAIYSELRTTIEKARTFARANYPQPHGAATCALDALWETLAVLPPLEELPGYVKSESEHARLVREWQDLARRSLGWELTRRELAELSLLLGVGRPPYKQLLASKGNVRKGGKGRRSATPAEVIDWEAERLDRTRRSLRDHGRKEVGKAKR